MHAILGASEHCIATHPSDMCVALAALDAQVRVRGADGERVIAVRRLPSPARRHAASRHEAEARRADHGGRSAGQRVLAALHAISSCATALSYAFALVSVAAALEIEAGTIKEAAIALGGVAHKPWRDRDAERLLVGEAPVAAAFARAAAAILREAKGQATTTSRSRSPAAPSCAR